MLGTVVFHCLLCVLGQAEGPPVTLPTEAAEGASEPIGQLPPADRPAKLPRRYRPTPPELVAEALMLPPGHTLTGQPMTLASILANSLERTEQLEVVQSYWRLVEAVAVYRFHLDYHAQLQGLEAPPDQAARVSAVLAAAKARLGEAELEALATQHTLAVQAGLGTDSALPLPADRPHVGPYMTRFRELFGLRPAPPAAQRLDRVLPIRFQAIEAQATALAVAEDARFALDDADTGDRWAERLQRMATLHRLQCEWIVAVCRYNQEIAEYAVAVAPPGTNGGGLVTLLIRPSQEPVRPLVSDDASGVQPAGYVEPVRVPSTTPRAVPPVVRNEPTPAVRPTPGEPTPAVRPGAALEPADATPMRSGSVLPERPVVPVEHHAPQSQPPEAESPAPSGHSPLGPALFDADGDASPIPSSQSPAPGMHRRTVERRSTVLPPLYAGLAGTSPNVRAKQLNVALHWNRQLPDRFGEPVELLACLERRVGGDRRGLIAAYWTVGEQAAAWQVRQQHGHWLDELSYAIPDDSPDQWRLRIGRAAAEAATAAAHAELVEAQFHLAERTGQSSDAVWPVPATRPHSGPYLLNLESLPPELARSWHLRRLADVVPRLSGNVREQAAAVVEADSARAEAEAAWQNENAAFDEVLHAIEWQTDQTLAFLATLTAYNQALAEYSLRVLPDGTSDQQLVTTLVKSD